MINMLQQYTKLHAVGCLDAICIAKMSGNFLILLRHDKLRRNDATGTKLKDDWI